MTAMAMPLVAVVMLNANTLMIGLLQAAVWLPWLLLGLPAAAWIDRFTPRPVMLICNIASLALFASVPLAAWTGLLTIGQLLIVALLSGIAGVFFSTAYQPYLTSLLPRKDLAEANAKLQGSESAAYIVGPGLGGVIAQVFGAVSALLVDALTFAVSALCLARIRVREPARAPQPKRRRALRTEIADGIRFIVRDPYLRAITLYGGATNFAGNIMHAVLVVFLVRSVGMSPGSTGGLLALAGLGGVVGAMLSSRLARRLGTARAVLVGEACTVPFGLLIPLTTPGPGLAFFMVGGTVLTAGVVAGNVITASFRQSYIPVAMLGRVTATTRLVIFGASRWAHCSVGSWVICSVRAAPSGSPPSPRCSASASSSPGPFAAGATSRSRSPLRTDPTKDRDGGRGSPRDRRPESHGRGLRSRATWPLPDRGSSRNLPGLSPASITRRSRARTRTGAGAAAAGRSRARACS
jgi:predicted MFS family arabinose efflux permease